MKLQELKAGDKFYPANKVTESTPIFEVTDDKDEFKRTRFIKVKNLINGEVVSKTNDLMVVKCKDRI